MELDQYQKYSIKTRRKDLEEDIFYYGLSSESANLLAIYKKALRDLEPESIWKQELLEEIGDTLWYLSVIVDICGYTLNECAMSKLRQFDSFNVDIDKLDFDTFQQLCSEYRLEKEQDNSLRKTTSLLGIVSECGLLTYDYQSVLRNKIKKLKYKDNPAFFGGILWYLADISSSFELKLVDSVSINIEKATDLFGDIGRVEKLFDDEFEWDEKFPRKFDIFFFDKNQKCKLSYNGVFIGDKLDDNSEVIDGYRFHDAIHLAHVAILGWSPVIRALLKIKRKSNDAIDRSEDGQRAIIIEEAIVALNFQYAKQKKFFTDNENISTRHLLQIKGLIKDLEVSQCTLNQWKKAIIEGFRVYNQLVINKGGKVTVNLNDRTITYSPDKMGIGHGSNS